MSKKLLSNIVEEDALREVQLNTLQEIFKVISKTSGPYGSSTMIMHNDRFTEYSKDGHKVLNNIKFFRPLEQSVHDELISITEHVVKTVGDGTTTAVELSYLIFKGLCETFSDSEYSAHEIITAFQSIVKSLSDIIAKNGRELTVEDIYHICMISTNGNKMVSEDISNIYKQFGTSVHIQLGTSNTESSILKTYDGIVFNRGFASPAFINKSESNTVSMRNPRIYHFADPVDTPELIGLFMTIFTENIYDHYQRQDFQYVPTVILVPSISQDIKSDLEDIEKIFYAFDQAKRSEEKPPFCIITGVNGTVDNISDIITLCHCPSIRKFINPDVQAKAIEEGTAPSKETVVNFYGSADSIEIDMDKTKIINPIDMFDKDAEPDENGVRPYSATYESLVNFYKSQIEISSQAKEDINTLANMKRKLHFLQANFVEYLVGGISAADRDNVKDLVDDAILNCRSAADSGVGYGAGFEGMKAIDEYLNNSILSELEASILNIVAVAYDQMINLLYRSVFSEEEAREKMNESLDKEQPLNLRTKSYDEPVLCSIDTDRVILDAISKIITIMYTSNQALLIEPTQNLYMDLDSNK